MTESLGMNFGQLQQITKIMLDVPHGASSPNVFIVIIICKLSIILQIMQEELLS